ncbi:MAG: hypothetical protein DRJ40_02200 [Thermoprotei archaeon]|nr:MAG: hypothetical protein DRJ40_02200 [Thermoprotei archaeon]
MEEVVIYVVGFSLTIIGLLCSSMYWLGRKFKEIDVRFEKLEERIGNLESRIEGVERKFVKAIEALKGATLAIHTGLIEFLGLKGVIERKEVEYLMSEAHRVMALVRLNPITKEELEFVLKVLSKRDPDKVTMEEAEKLIEIGKRWWMEDGREEAYRLFMTGLYIKAYLISKRVKQEQAK